jgi:hypothetical protein
MDAVADGGLARVEQPMIDGVVIGTGRATEAGAEGLSLTQSGYFRNYVLVFLAGACIATILLLVRANS